jgi:hypothetical protein
LFAAIQTQVQRDGRSLHRQYQIAGSSQDWMGEMSDKNRAEANRTPTCAFARQNNPFSDMADNICTEYLDILIISTKPFPDAI